MEPAPSREVVVFLVGVVYLRQFRYFWLVSELIYSPAVPTLFTCLYQIVIPFNLFHRTL